MPCHASQTFLSNTKDDLTGSFTKNKKMTNKTFIYIIILELLCFPTFTQAQTTMTISNGQMVMVGNNLVFENANLVNNATVDAQDGTILFKGSTNDVTVSGTSATTFNNLKIDKTSNTLSLVSDININNQLEMISGYFDLDSCDVTLGTTNGTIVGENSTTYIIASDSGEIIKVIALNAPSANNPGIWALKLHRFKI